MERVLRSSLQELVEVTWRVSDCEELVALSAYVVPEVLEQSPNHLS